VTVKPDVRGGALTDEAFSLLVTNETGDTEMEKNGKTFHDRTKEGEARGPLG
jgi:hypothetical protein